MHEEKILGNTPKNQLPRFGFISKSENSALENHYLKRWKMLIFTRGIPTFSNEMENEAIGSFEN